MTTSSTRSASRLPEPAVRSRSDWLLSPQTTFLNHGSFGSCPAPVLEYQSELRRQLERQPVQFLARDLEPRLDEARCDLAAFLGAQPDHLVFVPNATAGVNTVLRSLPFRRGDELLVTDHEYNACRNALEFVARRCRANVIVARVPFPLRSPDQVIEAVRSKVSRKTRLALLDHVSSPTALLFPIQNLVKDLDQRGIDTLVDGAHAPGMVPVHLDELGAAYYTGNCHKWLCAPKGAGFLHVRPDRQHRVRPLVISHGANTVRTDRSRFLVEFGWTGTWDPTAMLSVPVSIRTVGRMHARGWPGLMRRNHDMAVAARRALCELLNWKIPCPDGMLGSMASLPLPDADGGCMPGSPLYCDPLQDQLLVDHGIEVPIVPWPAAPQRLVRISCQLYNRMADYARLGRALKVILARA